MNSKTANLIALELGILIAIMAWLAFARLPVGSPHATAKAQDETAGSFATITPMLKSRNQARPAVDYRAEPEQAQPADEEPTPTVQQYDQQIASSPYASSGLEDDSIAGGSAYYNEVDQAPVITPPAYIVPPVTQIIEYRRPTQIIILSSTRSFVNRRRPIPCFGGGHVIAPHRPPGRVESHPGGGRLVPPRKVTPRPSPPVQGIRASYTR